LAVAATRAQPGHFQILGTYGKATRGGTGSHIGRDGRVVKLRDFTAAQADQELAGMGRLWMGAANKGVERRYAVDQALLDQEIKGAVDGRRRGRPTFRGERRQHVISANRAVTAPHQLQNTPPYSGQSGAPAMTDALSRSQGIGHANIMIMTAGSRWGCVYRHGPRIRAPGPAANHEQLRPPHLHCAAARQRLGTRWRHPMADQAKTLLDGVRFDAAGLVPVITQEHRTGEVMMMAWMNRESLEETMKTGRLCYWSRSRQELWRKGETSGHVQKLVEMRMDCDGDTLLALIEQTGAACHTGASNCFYQAAADGALIDVPPARFGAMQT